MFHTVANDEVEISEGHPKPELRKNYSIHAKFSIGPHKILNWYHNGSLLKSSNPFFSMLSDGLNAVLHIKSLALGTSGEFSLKIEDSDKEDKILVIPGKS